MSGLFKLRLTQWEFYLLLLTVLLQLLIAFIPDPFSGGAVQTDIDDYRNWTRGLVLQGLEAAYWGNVEPHIDYPPLVPYIYFTWGSLIHSFFPETFLNNNALDFLIKIPAVACNVLISYMLLLECKSRQITLDKTALLALMVNVPLIFDTTYWGQTDSVIAVLLLGSLLALQKQQLTTSYVLFTLACFTKPLAWPFALLILLVSLKKYTLPKVLRATTAALITAGLVLLPFALEGNLQRIISDLFLQQLDTMPYISVNAHNLWWIVATEATRWTHSGALVFGLISYKLLATLMFLIFYAVILFNSARTIARPDFDLLKTAAVVAMGFFILSPHMHENHLFNFFPLAFIFMMTSPRPPYRIWYMALMICSTFNMAIHDPYLARRLAGHSQDILVHHLGVGLELSRLIDFFLTSFITKLCSFIIVLIFAHLCWHELAERPVPKVWSWGMGLVLGSVALLRVV